MTTDYGLPFPKFTEEEYDYAMDNESWIPLNVTMKYSCMFERGSNVIVIDSIILVVCIFGLMGNGTVIGLLGFCIKGTPFTTYILNLAIADCAVLLISILLPISQVVDELLSLYFEMFIFVDGMIMYCFYFVYGTSQLLLTIISIDRCVSVLFPLWYRCRRPGKLSTVLCALVWFLGILILGTRLLLYGPFNMGFLTYFIIILLNSVVCLTVITVSTLILFVKFCFKSQQRQRGRLLTAILLTLFFFLFFAFPFNILYLIWYNPKKSYQDGKNILCYNIIDYSFLCAALNSFVNPLLYFLVGRKKKGLCRENLKLILRRVFIEEEEEAHR